MRKDSLTIQVVYREAIQGDSSTSYIVEMIIQV